MPIKESLPPQPQERIILPAFTLGMWLIASVMRMVGSAMIEVLEQENIRTTRSMGLSERFILWTHALKNVLIPVITILGSLQIRAVDRRGHGETETIFALPGIGRLTVNPIFTRDYPPVQAVGLVMAISCAARPAAGGHPLFFYRSQNQARNAIRPAHSNGVHQHM